MRPTPVSSLPARARYTCPGHVGIVPSFPRRDPRLPRPVGVLIPVLLFTDHCPLITAHFLLSPLVCADPKNAPITPLECAVPKTKDLKSFRMRSSEKTRGVGDKLLTRNPIWITVLRSIATIEDANPVGKDLSGSYLTTSLLQYFSMIVRHARHV